MQELIVNELLTIKLMLESIENTDTIDDSQMWQETDWGRDLKFKLKNQIMAHYLTILQDSDYLISNVNGTSEWIS